MNDEQTTGLRETTDPLDRIVRLGDVIEWLQGADALWAIEEARRDGVPEFAGDRVASAAAIVFGDTDAV